MIDFNDLDHDPMASAAVPAVVMSKDLIRQRAHVANGGDNASHECMKCRGTGRFGRAGNCFACNGTGKVTARKAGAQKAKVTRARNLAEARAAFEAEHAELLAGLRAIADWHSFASKLLDGLETYGSLTERQIEAARNSLAKVEEKRAAKRAEKAAETAAKSGDVGVERINALFDTAIGNGLKKPVFRTEFLTIKPAKLHPGTLYVTDKRITDHERGGAAYVGKIVAGKFEARREAAADTLAILCEIAADPLESAIRYGRATGTCGCCGRELTAEGSVEAGIGPVCATKWGL